MDTVRLCSNSKSEESNGENSGQVPKIDTYFLEKSPACVLVCPGGGYEFLSDVFEGSEIAEWFNSKGISAAVLYYRVAPETQPLPLSDAKRAMRYLRHNAEKFGFPKDKIGIMGFSAGGHVAGSASVHFENEENPTDEIDAENSCPDFQILCYPVITTDMTYAHQGSVINLLGKDLENEELAEYYSIEKQVTVETPPAFIWHTAEDDCVPMQNSLEYAKSLALHRVPTELHIYPYGVHGLALQKMHHTDKWISDLEKWLFDIILTEEKQDGDE